MHFENKCFVLYFGTVVKLKQFTSFWNEQSDDFLLQTLQILLHTYAKQQPWTWNTVDAISEVSGQFHFYTQKPI